MAPPIPQPETNHLYFAATAVDANNIESDYSNEAVAPYTRLPVTVTLAWDASPSANVTGYRLYQGAESGAYTNVLGVGLVRTQAVTVLPLPPAPRIVRFSMTNGLSITLTNPSGSLVLRPNWRRVTSTKWPVWIEGKTYEPPSEWAMLAGYYTNKTQPTAAGTKIRVERL